MREILAAVVPFLAGIFVLCPRGPFGEPGVFARMRRRILPAASPRFQEIRPAGASQINDERSAVSTLTA